MNKLLDFIKCKILKKHKWQTYGFIELCKETDKLMAQQITVCAKCGVDKSE